MEEGNSTVIEKPTSLAENKNSEIPKNQIISQTSFMAYASPFPPSSELIEYEKLLPGIAERIFKMAEIENSHRQKMESQTLDANTNLAQKEAGERKSGQWFAFIIAITATILGFYLVLKGKSISGTLFSGSGIASVLMVFYSNKVIKIFKTKG